ncbi:alpha/beta fold hydrolase [Dyella silvatica]|uniref:alpha/beta fold hydrolase n=1 Tax=Dyella silvatica TaxID=2992128 RepID=UPI0022599060|nr:alpha/beta fold hydrolase [Dyella silvatica]
MSIKKRVLTWLFLLLAPCFGLHAACVDNVVLVHGNTGSPSDFQNTYNLLIQNGYSDAQIYAPAWGNPYCAACNDHNGSEETPVRNAITSAIASSCTGHIDVIGHSMGATLAALEVDKLGVASKVDVFVGIAGAFHGLWSCGTYPFNVPTLTCGSWGLSVNSPFLDGMAGHRFGTRMVSIKSWVDEINCYYGVCTVGGVHTSTIDGEDSSLTYPYGHYQLLWLTASDQLNLLQ